MFKWRRYPKFGDVVAIPLSGGTYGFAQALDEPELAFFDFRATTQPAPEEIVTHPVAFRLWVVRDGPLNWKKLGKASVAPALHEPVPRFKKDPISEELGICVNETETPATYQEVRDLECAAVWETEHVIDRLEDHFAGRPNQWLMSLRPRAPSAIRDLISPLTDQQLRPLHANVQVVQFSAPLSDAEHKRVARFLDDYPDVTFRAYAHYKGDGQDLAFLRHYGVVRRFAADLLDLKSFDGLECLRPDLEYLGLGQSRKRSLSLKRLGRFKSLRTLFLETHRKDIDIVSQLTELDDVTLRSITLPDLSVLLPLGKLRSLDIKLGGTKNLGLLPEFKNLEYLELWMVRGLSDISPVSKVASLRFLFLQALKQVTALPDMMGLNRLKRVHIETMKGLRDLTPLRDAPSLEELLIFDMRHLKPEDLAPLVGHPKLRRISIALGSLRKNREAKAMFNLPLAEGWGGLDASEE